jgi:hypothetical protein
LLLGAVTGLGAVSALAAGVGSVDTAISIVAALASSGGLALWLLPESRGQDLEELPPPAPPRERQPPEPSLRASARVGTPGPMG